jgi:hypothetical protein
VSRVVNAHPHFSWWGAWRENLSASLRMPETLLRLIAGIGAALVAAAAGVASTFVSAPVAVRVTHGVPVILILARYR